MNLNAKTEYACLAMLELAQHYATGEPVQHRLIAERHGIPAQFLVQILHQLKRAGLVNSTRGACGGYQLTQPPQEVTLAELLDVVEGSTDSTTSAANASPLAPVLLEVCAELTAVQRERLEAITLADLLDRAAVEADPMWYI
ncbi:RrF2 family transcriptional regulator [Bythopirellula polymerisocia]|uniref:HTH-type transcriptional regulator CymR n=1 Tax=Bythopirellula polymerisocia TaxID=2528003 RepID=A0A5C6D2P5_9BACT|nr:Rrf2 family transcriptional regulator [Bythopirellula polymerisocia]TWU29927.1 HTH-type transcriptional regulator CymR [Bythopirellula polymerisocia]